MTSFKGSSLDGSHRTEQSDLSIKADKMSYPVVTVTRRSLKKNYTCVDNAILNDPDLTGAKGQAVCSLLLWMLSKPNNFRFYVGQIAKEKGLNKGTVSQYLAYLESLGYVYGFQLRDSKGRWTKNHPYDQSKIWLVDDRKGHFTGLSAAQKQLILKQFTSLESIDNQDIPPKTELPSTVKPPLLNTDRTQNTELVGRYAREHKKKLARPVKKTKVSSANVVQEPSAIDGNLLQAFVSDFTAAWSDMNMPGSVSKPITDYILFCASKRATPSYDGCRRYLQSLIDQESRARCCRKRANQRCAEKLAA